MNFDFLLSIDDELDRRITFLEDLNDHYQDTLALIDLIISSPDEELPDVKGATDVDEAKPSSEYLNEILAKAKEIRMHEEKGKSKKSNDKGNNRSSAKKSARVSKVEVPEESPAPKAAPTRTKPQTVSSVYKRQIRFIESNPAPNFAEFLFPSHHLASSQYHFLSRLYQRPYFPPSSLASYFTSFHHTVTWSYNLSETTLDELSSNIALLCDTYKRLWHLKLQRIHDSKLVVSKTLSSEEIVELYVLWYQWRLCIDIYENMMYELENLSSVTASCESSSPTHMRNSLISNFPLVDPACSIHAVISDEKLLKKWFKHQCTCIDQYFRSFSSRVEYVVETQFGQSFLRHVVSHLKECATLDPAMEDDSRFRIWKNAWREYQSCVSLLTSTAQDTGSCFFFLKNSES